MRNQWEYMEVPISGDEGSLAIDKLNQYGEEGWELVAIEPYYAVASGPTGRYIFKREKKKETEVRLVFPQPKTK